jgi:hypothetical protein
MIDNRVIERVMRMGIEYRTGKYDVDGLFALAARQIKAEKAGQSVQLEPFGYKRATVDGKLQIVRVVK